ncbi:NifB/NifX family molybdenum-iron cluster-binding protein [Pelotomaculum isophthalicicum]|uniref:NifB/NifX family molybdenum-iron cluster-binding protein n=1 Tax=Pelotomaculum isophthalicicum TaxID=342448 RepID=UPI0030B83023
MKIAISAQGQTVESKVDIRFGRCNWFVVVDTDTGDYHAVSNDQNLNAAQGAGIQSAEIVSRQGVEAVITGHCGPKAFRTLSVAGIKLFTGADGTVADTLERFKKGMLTEAEEADVEGHWL